MPLFLTNAQRPVKVGPGNPSHATKPAEMAGHEMEGQKTADTCDTPTQKLIVGACH